MSRTEITSCSEALRLLATHLDRELDSDTHAEMEHHLETCRSCYSRAEFEARLKDNLAELGNEPVPAELSARLQTLVQTFPVATED